MSKMFLRFSVGDIGCEIGFRDPFLVIERLKYDIYKVIFLTDQETRTWRFDKHLYRVLSRVSSQIKL